jgi:hypothetical protein
MALLPPVSDVGGSELWTRQPKRRAHLDAYRVHSRKLDDYAPSFIDQVLQWTQ